MNAPAHTNRQPLNFAASDLAELESFNASESLRDVIDRKREEYHRQVARVDEGTYFWCRNPHNPRARNPEVEVPRLNRLKNEIKYLLQLARLLETPDA